MGKLGYGYKGNSILSPGKRSATYGISFRKIGIGILLLLGLGVIIAGVWELAAYWKTHREAKSNSNTEAKKDSTVSKVTSFFTGRPQSGQSYSGVDSATASRYDKMLDQYRDGKYLTARDEARALLPKTEDTALYYRVSAILGKSNMALFTGKARSEKLIVYRVKAGDSLGSIANANNTTVEAIEASNSLSRTDMLLIGQKLNIYQGDWSATLNPERKEFRLLDGGKVFLILPLFVGSDIKLKEGNFTVKEKYKIASPAGSSWFDLRPANATSEATTGFEIRGTDSPSQPGRNRVVFFQMSNQDVNTLYSLAPRAMPVKVTYGKQ